MIAAESSFYVTGGTLRHDAPSYVERQADRELYDGLRQGEFCYVLTPRQMGKSSLMVRTAARLRREGIGVVILDLSAFGSNLTAAQWYDGLLRRTAQQLHLEEELEAFWRAQSWQATVARLGPLQRWIAALREVVLPHCPGRIVLFVDEIDAVRSLPFSTDEFFAAIRECYNGRSEDPELARLTFCLLGVATPADLIRETRTTPFNIGRRVELHDFTDTEAAPLARGLGRKKQNAAALLQRVLYWTGGHPYLTQRLCQAVASDFSVAGTAGVDGLCEALFLSPEARERDDNLLFVRDRLLRSEADPASVLDLYAQVRHQRRVADDDTNRLVSILRLSGITRTVAGALRVRNRIYNRVFDRAWIAMHMPDAELRRQRAAFRRGLRRAASASGVVLAVTTALSLTALRQAGRADRNAGRAAASARAARAAVITVGEERDRANRESARAHQAQRGEREQRLQAEAARQATERERQGAVRQGRIAEKRRAEAESERRRALRAEHVATEKLWESYLAQARALRWSGRAGQRFESLAVLARAARIRPTLELRNEAIACLALADLRHMRSWEEHPHPTEFGAFDATLQRYACSDGQGNISVRRSADNREIARLPGPNDPAWEVGSRLPAPEHPAWLVHVSPDGRFLAAKYHPAGKHDHMLFQVWDLRRGKVVLRVSASNVQWRAFDFSSDSRLVAFGRQRGSISLYELGSCTEVKRLAFEATPGCLAFQPHGRKLAVSCWETSTVEIRDVDTGNLITALPHPNRVYWVAWSPDGKRLAAACADFRIYVWDVDASRTLAVLEGHQADVVHVIFNHRGDLLASTAWDGTLRLWDPWGGRQLVSGPSSILHFGPDDRRVGYATSSSVGLGEVATGRECRTLYGHQGGKGPWSVDFSPDGRLMASASGDGARLWDVALGKEIAFLPAGESETEHATPPVGENESAFFHPDGKSLITTGSSGLRRWAIQPNAGTMIGGLRIGPPQSLGLPAGPGHVCVSRDGRMLAVVRAGYVHVLNSSDPSKQIVFQGPPGLYTIAISPDGRWVAAGSWPGSGMVRVWEVRSKAVRDLHVGGKTDVTFSPDGRWLVTGMEQEYRFWRVGSWQAGHRIPRDLGLRSPMAFTRDGRVLAVARSLTAVRLVDPLTGCELATLEAANPQMLSWLCFSPDGSQLAAAAGHHVVQIWDLRLVREQLAAMGLDWGRPPYPSASRSPAPKDLHATVFSGELSPNLQAPGDGR